jgi:Fe-S oxidoreductase
MWKERESGLKISLERIREALTVSPQIMVTACPFCLLMSMEGLQIEGNNDLKALDIAVLVEKFAK